MCTGTANEGYAVVVLYFYVLECNSCLLHSAKFAMALPCGSAGKDDIKTCAEQTLACAFQLGVLVTVLSDDDEGG